MFHLWIPSIETLTHQRLSVFGTTAGDAVLVEQPREDPAMRNPGTVRSFPDPTNYFLRLHLISDKKVRFDSAITATVTPKTAANRWSRAVWRTRRRGD